MKTAFLILLISLFTSLSGKVANDNFEGSCGDGWKESIYYTKSDGTSSVPKITITQSTIRVSHRTEGGGSLKTTHLHGTGGNYYLKPGDNTVNPGTYDHEVDGLIVNSGAIYSTICYR